jgi:hypothetical protein
MGLAIPINVYALAWTTYITIYLPFPTTYEVDGSDMNYTLPIYAFVLILCDHWLIRLETQTLAQSKCHRGCHGSQRELNTLAGRSNV